MTLLEVTGVRRSSRWQSPRTFYSYPYLYIDGGPSTSHLYELSNLNLLIQQTLGARNSYEQESHSH
jgi:hypothetical protein